MQTCKRLNCARDEDLKKKDSVFVILISNLFVINNVSYWSYRLLLAGF